MFARIIHTFGARALSAVINLLIAIALSQFLGPAGKGVQSLIITTITFILVFANLIGGATLVYLTPRHQPSLIMMPSYAWTVLVSLLSGFILYYFPIIEKAHIVHVCILAALNAFSAINTSVLIGKEKIAISNIISLVQPFTLIASLLIFFAMAGEPAVQHYLYSLYVSFAFSTVLSFILFVKYCGPLRVFSPGQYYRVIKEMTRLGIMNQVAHITQMLSFRLSYYVIDHYHGEAALGVYSNGISLAESIWLISKSISLVQYARISNTAERGDAARLTVSLIKFSVFASLILLIPLLIFPSSFYTFLFGEGFAGTRMVIWSLSFGVLIYNFSILTGHYFSGTGRYHLNALSSTLGLLISVALYYALIPGHGIVGAGWATSLSYLATSIILMVIFARDYPQWYKELMPTVHDLQRARTEFRNLFSRPDGL